MVAAALQSPGPPGLFGFTAIPHLKYNGCLNIDKTAFDAVVLAASGPFKQKVHLFSVIFISRASNIYVT